MIDSKTVSRIIDAAEIVGVVSDFVTLHRRGQNYLGLCPFHEDKRPSFTVSPAKNIAKCFSCGEGGTPLNFLMKHEHLSYVEALRYLAQKYNIPIVEREESPEEIERRSARERLIKANDYARRLFTEELNNSGEGRMLGLSYFKERGFTPETINTFGLGYAPAAKNFLSSRAIQDNISLETLQTLGLLVKQEAGSYLDRFRERVIFPIHSLSGIVVGFGGRILKSHDKLAKYINSPDSDLYNKRRELYGLYFAKQHISKQDKCLVVEGYTDVLSFHQSGIRNVVASSGTALTVEQARLIKRFTSQVTLIFDSDAAGIKAAMRGIDIMLAQDFSVKVVLLPDGHDPDSFAKENTPDNIVRYIEEHEVDFIRFKIDLLSRSKGDDPRAKAELINNIVESIAYIEDEIVREVYVRDSATLLEISEEALFSKIDAIQRERVHHTEREEAREQARHEAQLTPPEIDPADEEPSDSGSPPISATSALPNNSDTVLLTPSALELPLVQYIVRSGQETFTIEGYTSTVASLILDELADLKAGNALSPFFQLFMGEVRTLITEGAGSFAQALTAHPHDAIREAANKAMLQDAQLSSLHDDFQRDQEKSEALLRSIMTDLLSMKYKVTESWIVDELREIKSLSERGAASSDPNLLKQHLARLQNLNNLKREMATRLGDRVLTSITRIE